MTQQSAPNPPTRSQVPGLRFDVVAGLTAAAVVLPKAMAYATVAGLPVAVGLYTAFIPMIIYALLGTFFRANPAEFHLADGSGHAFWADQVIALDAKNPQVAARMARALENWRRYTPALQASIRTQLLRVRDAGVSANVSEIVGKALAGDS